jgi:homoserine dehydrogenase
MRGKSATHSYNLCLLGFGNVNRTLVRLLLDRKHELRDRHGIAWKITGVASRRLGWVAAPNGLDPVLLTEGAKSNHLPHVSPPLGDVRTWLRAAHADVLFEATSLNAKDGQPAIDHIRAALESGAHAITANKGPVLHAYESLSRLAAQHERRFLFESSVMDGVPIFSLFRENLPAIRLHGFHGILNSTTNVIITGMEEGLTFDESLKRAQALGVAETDATDDIDGWDAAIKTALLVRVLMGVPLNLDKIERDSIKRLSADAVKDAKDVGRPYKVVCRAARRDSAVTASVRLEQVPLSDPMAHVSGTSSVVYFETDVFPGLAITEDNPGLEATAYGMLADFVRAVADHKEHVK